MEPNQSDGEDENVENGGRFNAFRNEDAAANEQVIEFPQYRPIGFWEADFLEAGNNIHPPNHQRQLQEHRAEVGRHMPHPEDIHRLADIDLNDSAISASESQLRLAPMTAVPKVDEITALEYSALKVPYELLNKKFRIAQKTFDRHNYRIKEAGTQLLSKMEEEKEGGTIFVKKIAPLAKALMERLDALQTSFPQAIDDEVEMAKLLESRLNYLKGANATDKWAVETWRQQRVDRLIIDYLLRSGYFETAQKLAEQSDVQDMCNKTIFEIARQVEDSLSRHETDRCIEWIVDNKSKLRRLKSNFEVTVRIQECVELVKKGERLQAVLYARRHFSNLPPQIWTGPIPLQSVMGFAGFGPAYGLRVYETLCADSRWDTLVELFRKENARIFQLMEYSTFNACLCMGISAMKTPHCKPDATSRCPICQPEINELADDLPFAHSLNSKLVCAYSGEPLDENNAPLMLPNGRVYGERSISILCKDNYIKCPRTSEVFPLSSVSRVFVL